MQTREHRDFRVVRSILTYIHFWLPPPTRSPTSTRGLPSIGEGQPPFYSFIPFDGLRRQPLQNFLSSLERSELGRKEGGELLTHTTLLSSKNHRVRSGFRWFLVTLSLLKGWGIYRLQPSLNSELKIVNSRNFGVWRLHRLAELKD